MHSLIVAFVLGAAVGAALVLWAAHAHLLARVVALEENFHARLRAIESGFSLSGPKPPPAR